MLVEAELLKQEELFQFDREFVDEIAFPLGDRYPGEIFTNYFSYYGGFVKKYRPKRILEIGVRYGYTGAVFCLAAKCAHEEAFGAPWLPGHPQIVAYYGIDDESYHGGSCAKAQENLDKQCPFAYTEVRRWNSFDGLPNDFLDFDLIHIDGNHDTHGVWNDLKICWPRLNTHGIILLDDYQMPPIEAAIHNWLALHDNTEEVIAVQKLPTERGMVAIQRTGETGPAPKGSVVPC